MTIVDGCVISPLTLTPNPPVSTPISYTLRDAQKDTAWSSANILSTTTTLDCGEPVFEILDSNGNAIDNTIFEDIQPGTDANTFRVLL